MWEDLSLIVKMMNLSKIMKNCIEELLEQLSRNKLSNKNKKESSKTKYILILPNLSNKNLNVILFYIPDLKEIHEI